MNAVTDVVIIGAGGAARDIFWIFDEINRVRRQWNVLGFIENEPARVNTKLCGVPVLGGDNWLQTHLKPSSVRLVCGIGAPRARRRIWDRFTRLGYRFCTVIDPGVRMSRWVEIGPGTIIAAGNIITTNVKIGSQVLVNLNCAINHDVVVGDYCLISPGCRVCGAVMLEDGVDLGAGTTITQGKRVGAWSVVGAGAVVISDIPPNVIAVGAPCRTVKSNAGFGEW